MELTEDLRVGGKAEAGGLIKARSVLVGGKVEARRVEALDEIRTNTLRTRDGAKADYIELGRRGEAEGPIVARKVLIRERARVEDIHADEVTLRRGCRALNIYADRVTVETDCRISGEVKYTDSLRAERDVRFAYEPEKTEKLPESPL
jgi:cytoskeletal protein CcmA (bactofilin family)